MKRFGKAIMAAVMLVLHSVGTAIAQDYPPKPPKVEGVQVVRGAPANEGLAATGANVKVWMLIAAVLIVVGVVTVWLSKRRATAGE